MRDIEWNNSVKEEINKKSQMTEIISLLRLGPM